MLNTFECRYLLIGMYFYKRLTSTYKVKEIQLTENINRGSK